MSLYLNSFLLKAEEQFANIYSYNKVQYVNLNTEIVITCPIHGDFMMKPSKHLEGGRCNKCIEDEKRQQCIKLYNDLYDYSKTDFSLNSANVTIGCKVHGDFTILLSKHLRNKHGCPACKKPRKQTNIPIDFKGFVVRANIIYPNQYIYDESSFIDMFSPINITCRTHNNTIKETPNIHLSNKFHCLECKSEYLKNIVKSMNSDYDWISHNLITDKVKFRCKTCSDEINVTASNLTSSANNYLKCQSHIKAKSKNKKFNKSSLDYLAKRYA